MEFLVFDNSCLEKRYILRENRTIQSRESGEIDLKKWDHLIKVEEAEDGKTIYTDIVDINNAGIFTLPYFIFASLFYRHKQKWRKLADNDFNF